MTISASGGPETTALVSSGPHDKGAHRTTILDRHLEKFHCISMQPHHGRRRGDECLCKRLRCHGDRLSGPTTRRVEKCHDCPRTSGMRNQSQRK